MPPKKAVRKKERRRMARADAQLSMRVDGGLGDSGVTPIVTESRNISGSGVYCFSPHYLPPLSKIGLTIVLPQLPGSDADQRLLKCEAIVVRCQGAEGAKKSKAYELACSFLDLHSDTRAMLDEYVVWRNLQALRDGAREIAPARTDHGADHGTDHDAKRGADHPADPGAAHHRARCHRHRDADDAANQRPEAPNRPLGSV